MTKRCNTCWLVLPLEAFSTRRASRDGRQNRCRECWRSDYIANCEVRKTTAAAGAHATLRRHRKRLQQYLEEHPCVDCGEDDIRCLEFDHRDPAQKLANVSALVAMHVRWERVLAEIEKCDVRCSNCHAKRTAEQRNTWRHQRWLLDAVKHATSGVHRLQRLAREPADDPEVVGSPDQRFQRAAPGVFRIV